MKKLSKIFSGLVLVFLLLIAGLLIASLFPIKGNYQIKIVQSGSMEPAIKTGSIVVVKPTETYKVGDVITFGEDTKTVSPTTHRIAAERVLEGKIYFTTKCDANEDSDAGEVTKEKIIGRVLLDVPYLGYLIDFAKKPAGFIIFIGLPALMVIIDEVKKILDEMKRLKKQKASENEADQNESVKETQKE